MNKQRWIDGARTHLMELCNCASGRSVGSLANQQAAAYLAAFLRKIGFQVETPGFNCLDWKGEGASLRVIGETFGVFPSPFSLGCRHQAPLTAAGSLEELQNAGVLSGRILLLHSELSREQLMPRNFKFYNPEEHQNLVRLLDAARPLAVLGATGHNPETAGAIYPCPLIEDGDFHIPNAYMSEEEGARLLNFAGQTAELEIRATRRPSLGCNVTAKKGSGEERILFFAHFDTKIGTPGALDNAAGVVSLLLLAEMLAEVKGNQPVEITLLNGEDHYSSAGELLWLAENEGRLDEICLGINLDAIGFIEGGTAYSLYGCSPGMSANVRQIFGNFAGLGEGQAWYQSDHSILLQNGVPAMAITSEAFVKLCAEITHTDKDRPELVDLEKLVETAQALHQLLLTI
jgi:aminopeptidase YwaD